MLRLPHTALRGPARCVAVLAALSAPAASGTPAIAEDVNTTVAQSFADMAPPLRRMTAAPGAVDITAIDIPIEVPPPRPAARSIGNGMASYYGRRFHGRLTANGERFNMNAMTAAHKTLPFGTRVRVTNPSNGKSVTVRINDRGPFIRGRTIDLSRAAASKIGLIQRGHGRVQLAILK